MVTMVTTMMMIMVLIMVLIIVLMMNLNIILEDRAICKQLGPEGRQLGKNVSRSCSVKPNSTGSYSNS